MARQYVPVLQALKAQVVAVGRSVDGSHAFAAETGIQTLSGGITRFAKTNAIPKHAIITVDADKLAQVTIEALTAGCERILVEKPGGLTLAELTRIRTEAKRRKASVYIGYNRRFYATVQKAREYIKADGGATSCTFQFNERITQRETLPTLGIPQKVQDNWFIANATHVIDLAFFLCGEPKKIVSYAAAGPLWTPQPTFFTGAGMTKGGASFTYHSNWELAGPWSVEIGTKNRKLILAPLEELKEEVGGEVRVVELDTTLDTDFKAGVYRQTKSFFTSARDLPTLDEQIAAFSWYKKIERGTT
jgi:predicted dehydrogenase